MQGLVGYLMAATISAGLGGLCLATASYQRALADAQTYVATRDYDAAADALDAAARYAEYASWLPWIGRDPLNDVRTREAALQYWQGAYDSLLPEQGDAVTSADPDNVDLQLVVANAAFRTGQTRMKNRAAAVQALDEAMSGYLNVLKHPEWREDAAYNYEYVARLRDDIARARRKPEDAGNLTSDLLGQAGTPSVPASQQQFEIYIPLESDERPETGEAGKAAPRPRRG